MEVLSSMDKYKVNIQFKEDGKSLNEKIIQVLKMEINKKINYINNYYPQERGSIKSL